MSSYLTCQGFYLTYENVISVFTDSQKAFRSGKHANQSYEEGPPQCYMSLFRVHIRSAICISEVFSSSGSYSSAASCSSIVCFLSWIIIQCLRNVTIELGKLNVKHMFKIRIPLCTPSQPRD